MLCMHDSHFILYIQYINGIVAHVYALEVVQNLLCRHLCVKGDWLAQLVEPRFVERINKEPLFFPFRRLVCVLVGDAGVMDGFGFGADHPSCAIINRFVVDCWTCWTG